MKQILLFLGHLLLFSLLTIITQIGGIVYVLSLIIFPYWKKDFRFKKSAIFFGIYLGATFLVVPLLAPLFGREKVKHSEFIRPTNYATVLLNRNYVRPKMNALLDNTLKDLQAKQLPIYINYLDANFPFWDKFPLLPHLSHNDGKKLDISLVFEDEQGRISPRQKSFSGYGVYEGPGNREYDQTKACKAKGYFQYDHSKYMSFGHINKSLSFSQKGTEALIRSILKQADLGKIFLEPHLKTRLGLKHKKVRFHGCRAVRHDDHIHIQLK